MRILSTNLGQDFSRDLAREIEESFNNKQELESLLIKPTNPNNNNINTNKGFFKTSIEQTKKYPYSKRTKSSVTETLSTSEIKRTFGSSRNPSKINDSYAIDNQKMIRIKQNKISIPKAISEKYNNDENYGTILQSFDLSQLKDVQNNKGKESYYSNNNCNSNINKHQYSFKEIIKITAQNNLRKKLEKEEEKKKGNLS